MNNEKLREEIRQVVQACPFGPLTELLNRCYVALGERPAHDVASVPEWWKIERSFDVLPHPCVDGKSHQPTIKIVLPACAPDDMAAFDVRDQIAETVRKLLYAAPVSEAKAQVMMPERAIKDGGKFSTELKVTGWNACLDEFARLNGGKP